MIFVTGGTGLVGSHILLELSQKGEQFKALKRDSSSFSICENIFKHYNAEDLFEKINWVVGDINDIPSLESGMQNCDMVLHAAGVVSFAPCIYYSNWVFPKFGIRTYLTRELDFSGERHR